MKEHQAIERTATADVVWAGGRRAKSVARFEAGASVTYVTCGGFGMADLLREALEWTGPAEIHVATWTIARRDILALARHVASGCTLRLLVDTKLRQRHPRYADLLDSHIGRGAYRGASMNARWAVAVGVERAVSIRGSANMGRNPKIEQLDVDCSVEHAQALAAVSQSIFDALPEGWPHETAAEAKMRSINPVEAPDARDDLTALAMWK